MARRKAPVTALAAAVEHYLVDGCTDPVTVGELVITRSKEGCEVKGTGLQASAADHLASVQSCPSVVTAVVVAVMTRMGCLDVGRHGGIIRSFASHTTFRAWMATELEIDGSWTIRARAKRRFRL